MTKEQINKLLSDRILQEKTVPPKLIETHISWVIINGRFVYKIKKPIQYSFLDFSTLDKRKFYCEREIELNKRLTDEVYIDVQPIISKDGHFLIGGDGEVIDYAVRMRKLDNEKQMDVLLLNNKVTASDIRNLAEKIATFHKSTDIIYQKDYMDIKNQFNDLEQQSNYLEKHLNKNYSTIIRDAINLSNDFLERNKNLLANRLQSGFFRDCHGDLHSRNIFLLPSPVPFDCIEFNDDFRQIDVLNEVAFLCMDLDSFGRQDLSDLFFSYYNSLFPSVKTPDDRMLFIYYKSYRSNIRAKVNSLRARSAENEADIKQALSEAGKYLQLMWSYMKLLNQLH
jgi:aminoglycoside phosphotransferase family enzyme